MRQLEETLGVKKEEEENGSVVTLIIIIQRKGMLETKENQPEDNRYPDVVENNVVKFDQLIQHCVNFFCNVKS